jgi:hypothetical protein
MPTDGDVAVLEGAPMVSIAPVVFTIPARTAAIAASTLLPRVAAWLKSATMFDAAVLQLLSTMPGWEISSPFAAWSLRART